MDIIRKSQHNTYSVPLCEGSLVHRELMGDHYMLLVFNSEEAQHFRLGDYCDTDFGRFELTDLYEPEYNEDGGFKYSLRLDAYYMKWKNKRIKFTPSNQQSEMSFTLTRDLEGHMELFMANLAYLGTRDSSYLFNGSTAFTFSIDYTHVSHKMMPVAYDSLSLIEALNQYAEKWECEWWVVDNVIHLGRCEGNVSVATFELNNNVAQMSRAQGSKEYITRLYVFGSERNIPANYRKSESEMVVNGVVQRRLMLPEGTPYLQVDGITEEQAVEGVLILDEVYPRTQCRVGGVSTYTSKGTDAEGNETTETFYRVSDTSGFINSITNDMRLDGDSFHIRFTSGQLNGMEFECNLIANDQRIGKCFEIIANEDYGIKLPREGFCPSAADGGDQYIIFGWDATKIANTNLIRNAEQELVTEGNKYLTKSQVDPSEYTCTMISKKMQDIGMPVKYGRDLENGNESYVPIPYDLGDKVQMVNPALFGSSRSSRIIGYEIKLDIPADSPQFIVGESLRYSKSGALENKVNELTYGGNLYTGNGAGGGGTVYIIGTGDTTPASNKNVYSAIRSDNQYARKDRNDVIKSLWTFKNGNGAKRGLQTDDYLLNTNEGNLFGKGFELVSQTNAQGDTRTRLEIDELFVRIKAFFASLEIREMSYVGGNYIFSAAGSKIYYVEWLDASGNVLPKTSNAISSIYTFRCYLYSDDGTTATMNKWAVDDQVICQTFNIDAGVHQNVSNKRYWRRVPNRQDAIGSEIIKSRALEAIEKQYLDDVEAINNWQVMTEEEEEAQAQALEDLATARTAAIAAVNAGNAPQGAADAEAFTSYQYVDISMDDCEAGSDYPEDGDTIVQLGNWTNAARQGIIYLQVEGAGSPAIMEYSKVGADGRHFVMPDPNLLLSPTKNVIYGEFHSVVDSETGNTGNGDTIEDQLRALIDRLNDIQNQADKKFEMWFGTYVPLPNIIFSEVENTEGSNPASMGWYEVTGDRMYETTEDTSPVSGKTYYIKTDNYSSVNYPASDWNTEALKALHAQDLFYDTMREPVSDGGRAWRWEAISVDGTVIYRWIETFDKDTIDALEKISDVASDGKLTGGAEKTRVYIDWMKAVQDYAKYEAQARDYGISVNDYWGENENLYQAYVTAFKKLARLLNGDDTTSESLYVAEGIMNGTTAPAWLADLSTTTVIPSPAIYRQVWNTYYAALAALLKEIQKRAKALADKAQEDATKALTAIDGIAADGKLSTTELPDLKREFETAYRQREEMTDLATDDTTHKLIDETLFTPLNAYLAAFKALANYLNMSGYESYSDWTEPSGGTYSVSNSGTAANATYNVVAKSQLANADFPSLMRITQDIEFAANWSADPLVLDNGVKFRDLWADLERKQVALANAMATLTKETADGAQESVDNLADDKILSAGSEKSKLLLEWLDVISAYEQYTPQAVDHLDWLGTTGTEGTVRTALSTAKDTFIAKVKALGTFLNGGVSWDYAYNAASKPLPLYLGSDVNDGFSKDTSLTAHDQTAAGYRTCWSQYYDAHITLLRLLTKAGKLKTEKAQADATEALNAIDGIAADGKLSTTELPDLKREFETAYRQREEMTDLATDDTTHKLIDETLFTPLNAYLAAFKALANYLNMSGYESYSDWTEPSGGTYSVSNSGTAANATYNVVAKSQLANADFPSLMRITQDIEFAANWSADPLVLDNGVKFRDLWADLERKQVALANAMATLIKGNADDALEQLDEFADDNILTEFEKLMVLREWDAVYKEFPLIIQQATNAHVSSTAYSNAYYMLANYLVDLTTNSTGNRNGYTMNNASIDGHTYNFTVLYQNPQMLCFISGNTNISGSTFKTYWGNYYKEKSNLLAALSASKVNYFVGTSVPSAPYFEGDLWLKLPTSYSGQLSTATAEDGEMMVCINECTTAGNETEQDWANLKEITEKRDPRILLAALAEKAYDFIGGYVRQYGYTKVFFASSAPSGSVGDIWYDGSTLYQYVDGDGWESVVNESLQTACNALYNVIGGYTIKIFNSTTNTSQKHLYDLCVTRIQFTDTNLPAGNAYRTVDGGLEIRMYGEDGWEIIQESTRSLIENLKGYIRMVAFGSADGTIQSAGIVTSSNFVNMFATAQDGNGQTIAQAYLSAFVTKRTVNGQTYLQSGIKIAADQIELTGTDSISMLVNGISSGNKQYGLNLLPNSIINETSKGYGFAVRSLKLEAGKTYTLSAKGIVNNALPSNMVLKVYIFRYKDSSETNVASEIGVNWANNSASLEITKNSGAARIASVSITAYKTATYQIASYLYDNNLTNGTGNGGTRTYPVTVEWYKVEEGSTATPWVASDADGTRFENYVVNPLAIGGTKADESCATYTDVTDPVFGKVMQIAHNIDGHWQLCFTRRSSYSALTDNYATFFVICKEVSNQHEAYTSNSGGTMVRRKLRFGDSNDVSIVDTSTAAFIDLGNGWRKYYATKKMTSALASTFGICHVMGTWQIYSVGIVLGGTCPTTEEIMDNNSLLSTGINIVTGKIELRADKVTFTSSDGTISNKIWIDPTNGTLHATNAEISGKITATNGGDIGGFKISAGSNMYSYSDGLTGSDNHTGIIDFMSLSSSLLVFRQSVYSGGTSYTNKSQILIGGDTVSSVVGGAIFGPMTIRVNRTTETYVAANGNFGINLTVEGAKAYDDMVYTGNHAIFIEKGNIMGFRKRTRRLSANATLSKYDSNIICINNSFTITLPADCEDGQEFVILSLTTNNITIQPSTGDKINHSVIDATAVNATLADGNISLPYRLKNEYGDPYDAYIYMRGVLLVYDKTNKIWLASFMV